MSFSFILFFVAFLFFSFFLSNGILCIVGFARMHRRRKETNARQQEHNTHQTENERQEFNIRRSAAVYVMVCQVWRVARTHSHWYWR